MLYIDYGFRPYFHPNTIHYGFWPTFLRNAIHYACLPQFHSNNKRLSIFEEAVI